MAKAKIGGSINLDLVSTPLPSLKEDTSFEPRMLTPSEVDWLKQNKGASLAVLKSMADERIVLNHQQAA